MTPADLLRSYAIRRDAEAIAEIVRLHQRMVLATCRRNLHDPADLDDAVQETFLRLAQKAGELKSNLAGWLYRCAGNVATDINRRRASRQKHEAAAAIHPAQGLEDDPQRQLAELREHLDAAMARLDPAEADLIAERFFVGRPQTELAIELGLSQSAVSARIDRAVESLRRHLGTMGCAAVAAGGAAMVVSLLEAETASAIVPAALTANIVKIGLSAVPLPFAGTTNFAPMEFVLGIAAVIVVVVGIWISFGRGTAPSAQSFPPSGPAIPSAPPNLTVGITTVMGKSTDLPTAAPIWQATQPAQPGAILSGRVVDRAGKPVADATITLIGNRVGGGAVKTDAQGNYAFFTIAQPGEYNIGVQAAGFVKIEPAFSSAPAVQLTRNSNARRDLVIDRGVTAQISVTDANGQTLPPVMETATDGRTFAFGTQVYADPQSGNDFGRLSLRAEADPLGIATFMLPVSPTPYIISVWTKDFAPGYTRVTAADPAKTISATLKLDPGVTAKGVAICTDGKPATGWRIVAQPVWWINNSSTSGVEIDKDGNFTLTNISPGKYSLSIFMPDLGQSQQIATVDLPPKDTPLRVNVPMSSPGLRTKVVGHLRVIGPMPDNITVRAMSLGDDHQFYSDMLDLRFGGPPGGRGAGGKPDELEYSFGALPPGAYRITFESTTAEAKSIESVQLPGNISRVDLIASGKLRLTGIVTDASTGAPIPHFAVRLCKTLTLGNGPNYVQDAHWIQVSDPNGRYSVTPIGPGIYQAQVSVDGYAWIWSDRMRIEQGTVHLNFKVTAGGTLNGLVVDAAGNPVAGAKAIPLSMARSAVTESAERFDSEAGAVTTGADGRFSIPHLAVGTETLKVVAPDFAPTTAANLKVTEGQTSDAGTIKLGIGGAVEGTIYDGDGAPAPGVTLQFQDASGYSGQDDEVVGRVASVTSDSLGKFRVGHLAKQILYVNAAERYQRMGVITRVVRPMEGRTARLDFGGPAPVTGRLMSGGQPLASKRVIMAVGNTNFGPVILNGTTNVEGKFTFHGAPPGRYKIYCQLGTRQSGWTSVREVLASGQPMDLGDIVADAGEVLINLTADDPADLDIVKYVDVIHPQTAVIVNFDSFRALRDDATGSWRATNVPAGPMDVSVRPGSYTLYIPFVRKTGDAETKMTVHIPHNSVALTLSVSNAAGQLFCNNDDTIRFSVSADPTQPPTKVPPGTYHQIDSLTRVPLESVAPIVLKENETRELHADGLPPLPATSLISLRTWTPDGVAVTDAIIHLFDATGVPAKFEGDSDFGPVFSVRPGACRAILDLPGSKSITRQIDVAPPERRLYGKRWTEMDIVAE
jgi:RNA polymerase sigma factor (sigma-70 family)